ncbi:hypothetical protein C8Q75DRAFT_155629 [Abortiporus biennis]|nr:hypothetical protein C8Q75DRAFT_155629 [Abortiporus biennis]
MTVTIDHVLNSKSTPIATLHTLSGPSEVHDAANSLVPPTSPRLPLELCDYILDHLGSDKQYSFKDRQALIKCCLTCRAWLSRSRRHLYLKIQVDFSDLNYSKMKSFFSALENTPYLRGLTMEISFEQSSVETYHLFLIKGQKLLPNLRKVRFEHTPLLHHRLTSIRRPVRNITSLEIIATIFTSLLDFRRIIESFFPNVTYLSFTSSKFNSLHISNYPTSLPVCRRLNAISLSSLHVALYSPLELSVPILKWLSRTQTMSTLRSIWLENQHLSVLSTIGHCVEDLVVYWSSVLKDNGENDPRHALVWEHNHNLAPFGSEILPQLKRLLVNFTWIHDSSVSSFCDMLMLQQPSSQLRCIQLASSNPPYITDAACSMLDDTISHPNFSNVTSVEVQEEFWGRFPKVEKKGVVLGRLNQKFWLEA